MRGSLRFRRSVGDTSKQPYFHLSACRRSSGAGIQSAIQAPRWTCLPGRIEDMTPSRQPQEFRKRDVCCQTAIYLLPAQPAAGTASISTPAAFGGTAICGIWASSCVAAGLARCARLAHGTAMSASARRIAQGCGGTTARTSRYADRAVRVTEPGMSSATSARTRAGIWRRGRWPWSSSSMAAPPTPSSPANSVLERRAAASAQRLTGNYGGVLLLRLGLNCREPRQTLGHGILAVIRGRAPGLPRPDSPPSRRLAARSTSSWCPRSCGCASCFVLDHAGRGSAFDRFRVERMVAKSVLDGSRVDLEAPIVRGRVQAACGQSRSSSPRSGHFGRAACFYEAPQQRRDAVRLAALAGDRHDSRPGPSHRRDDADLAAGCWRSAVGRVQ